MSAIFKSAAFPNPSIAALRRIEFVLTVTLVAQMAGLALRYTI